MKECRHAVDYAYAEEEKLHHLAKHGSNELQVSEGFISSYLQSVEIHIYSSPAALA
jgi:hypothetical protein